MQHTPAPVLRTGAKRSGYPMRSFFAFFVLAFAASPVAAQSFDQATLAWHLPWGADWVTARQFMGNHRVAAGDNLRDILVWDLPAGKERKRWQTKGWTWALRVDPEGKSVIVSERLPLIFDSGRHSGLKLWDVQKGEMKADLKADYKDQMIAAAAFSPDGK